MFIQRQDDGTFATTPVLGGMDAGALYKAGQCEHEWIDDGKSSTVKGTGISMQMQKCRKCKFGNLFVASRFRFVGDPDEIAKYLETSMGARKCAETNT